MLWRLFFDGAHDLLQKLKQEKMIQENRFSCLHDNLPNLWLVYTHVVEAVVFFELVVFS